MLTTTLGLALSVLVDAPAASSSISMNAAVPAAAFASSQKDSPAPPETRPSTNRQAAPTEATCDSPQHAQLDFWLGEWEVRWTAASGESGIGMNRVVRDHRGCVIVERYQDTTTGFSGTSISSYRPNLGRWAMTFMATGGFYFQATGGPTTGRTLQFDIVAPSPDQGEGRVRFENIGPNAFTWRFQMKPPGGDWSDLTVSRYQRRATVGDRERGR